LAEAGLISSPYVNVKLILKGELKNKKTVKLQGASANAVDAVGKAGGNFSTTPRLARPNKKTTEK
jgi:ribosomal protein L15